MKENISLQEFVATRHGRSGQCWWAPCRVGQIRGWKILKVLLEELCREVSCGVPSTTALWSGEACGNVHTGAGVGQAGWGSQAFTKDTMQGGMNCLLDPAGHLWAHAMVQGRSAPTHLPERRKQLCLATCATAPHSEAEFDERTALSGCKPGEAARALLVSAGALTTLWVCC